MIEEQKDHRGQERIEYENSPITEDIRIGVPEAELVRKYTAVQLAKIAILGEHQIIGLENKLEEAEGHSLTNHLTGLPNRRKFDMELERAYTIAERAVNAKATPRLSVVVLDLDFFKRHVNDKHGHPAGDYVLKEIAQILRGKFPEGSGCLPARVGGEEFSVLLPYYFEAPSNIAGSAARALPTGINSAQEIHEAIGSHAFVYNGTQIPLTASVGVTGYVPGDTTNSLYARADAALNYSKRTGRNRVTSFKDDKSIRSPNATIKQRALNWFADQLGLR